MHVRICVRKIYAQKLAYERLWIAYLQLNFSVFSHYDSHQIFSKRYAINVALYC